MPTSDRATTDRTHVRDEQNNRPFWIIKIKSLAKIIDNGNPLNKLKCRFVSFVTDVSGIGPSSVFFNRYGQ